MRGRKPKPNALKKLTGNPGKRKLNDREPTVQAGLPECPAHLDDAARAEWNRLLPLLAASRIVTALDGTALAALCQVYSRWVDAEQHVQEGGAVVLSSVAKVPMLNPYFIVANKTFGQMRQMLAELGMTPSSRSRVRAVEAEKQNELDAFNSQP